MKKYLILLFLFFSGSLVAQQKDETDKIYIEAIEFSNEELRANKEIIFGDTKIKTSSALLELLIPSTIDFAVNQISTALKKRAEKFIGKYSTKYVGDNFYEVVDTASARLKIKHFVIIRESAQQRNSEIVLNPVLSSDGAFFRLEASKVHIKKGRTDKIKNKIDIELNIAVISKNIKDETYEDDLQTTGLKILIEGLYLGKEFTDLKNASTQWIKVPKLSQINNKIVGGGTFELLVDVTETDSFKDRATAISTQYDANKKTLEDILKELFDKKDN